MLADMLRAGGYPHFQARLSPEATAKRREAMLKEWTERPQDCRIFSIHPFSWGCCFIGRFMASREEVFVGDAF